MPKTLNEDEGDELLWSSQRSSSEDEIELNQHTYFQGSKWNWLCLPIAVLVSLIVGYLVGMSKIKYVDRVQFGLPMPPGSFQTTWQHNLTFTQKPDLESEAAWASIIPTGRGFVHHDELAPFISNIAVFHQLHCLHAMLIAYYEALESPAVANLTDVPDFENVTETRIAVFHIRHCYDYIRQALMCAADTNLEELDPETHLTNGWGQPKQCRSYEDVFTWAERYANSTDTGIVT